jgi:hypothetical protein
MNTITINLTIGKETREVQAIVEERGLHTFVHVSNLMITTSHGNQQHKGWADFLYKEGVTDYKLSDACDVRYPGMRGNGHAQKSMLRNVSF